MERSGAAGGTVLKFPRPAAAEGRAEQGVKLVGDRRYYPRRFHPYYDPAPFFLPILITVIGAILALGSGWAVVHVHRAHQAAQASPVQEDVPAAAAE